MDLISFAGVPFPFLVGVFLLVENCFKRSWEDQAEILKVSRVQRRGFCICITYFYSSPPSTYHPLGLRSRVFYTQTKTSTKQRKPLSQVLRAESWLSRLFSNIFADTHRMMIKKSWESVSKFE